MIEQFIKDLEHVCDLLYYEGPYISLMKDSDNNPYLMFALEPDSEWGKGWKWIIFKTSKALLRKFLNRKLSHDELRENRIECDVLGDFGVKVSIGVEKYPVPMKLVYSNITILTNTDRIDNYRYFEEDMIKKEDLQNFKKYLNVSTI